MDARRQTLLVLVGLAGVLAPAPGRAHPFAPALLQLDARDAGRFDVLWRLPSLRARGAAPSPLLPQHCRSLGPPVTSAEASRVDRTWSVDCGERGLIGQVLEIVDLTEPTSVVVRVVLADGRTIDGVVGADRPRFVVPPAPSPGTVARSYLRLGLEHIASGPDHLLFVLGLVLLASTWRRIVATVTAFTIGHSVTLALAAMGVVRLPSGPIDLAIAVSVLVVAVQVARRDAGIAHAAVHPWTIAAGFGLLHGLGFAAALTEAGLPRRAIPLALVFFNLGIELGQIAFVLIVLALSLIARRLLPRLPKWATRGPAYAMGTLAAYWCFERAAAWLG